MERLPEPKMSDQSPDRPEVLEVVPPRYGPWRWSEQICLVREGKILEARRLGVPDLHAADLSGLRLEDLRSTLLEGANLYGSDLSRTELGFADVTGAFLAHANLSYSIWNNAVIDDACFDRADLSRVSMEEAHVRRSSFIWATLNGAQFRDASISDCDARMVSMMEANFWGAKVERSNMSGAGGRVCFKHARFEEVNFDDADLSGSPDCWSEMSGVRFISCSMRKADVRWATTPGASFHGSDLEEANLAGLSANNTDFGCCVLRKANMIRTRLQCSDLEDSDLTGADLRFACLVGAKLKGATLAGARLSGSILSKAEFGDDEVRGADLQDVEIWPLAQGSALSTGPTLAFTGCPASSAIGHSPFGTGHRFLFRV